MPDHDAFRPDGKLNIPSQAAADYIAREGTLQPYEPTMREKAESAIAGALESLGMSKGSARDSAVSFTGTTDSSRGGMGVGVLDFIPPFSIPTALQEAGREVERAQTATDYIAPALTVGFSAIESIPAAKLATKPLKGFIDNLAAKAEPEPLIAAAGPKVPRRTVVKGLAATPVAGALSKLPLGKVDEVAPVARAARLSLPENFNILRDLPNTKRLIDDYVGEDLSVQFDDIDDIDYEELEDLVEQVSDSDRFDIADTFDDVRESMKEELMEVYELTSEEADELMKKEGFDLPVSQSEEIKRMKSFEGTFQEYKSEYPNSRVSISDWANAVEKDPTIVEE